ncbi:CAMK/RAD53 protein kinase Mek1 [Schizosaccharomyces japonicus yFS275]|uniref:CAMK/RAD53 protein kinase Mek1 n=1 Tax=Schizosaccharomyces japonicus (strain yFS275 / FY16936) TaxID=402676 RepID=B6K485_SCHJY|nr:CAMK/RAD53 protein kinase Mek1 [Schizosaccharomyces japonicus yFS275]EEB08292.1 CAMK/RAD53 protein kinase Mek1 [Schizosaccharomyces japonicus yFS275]
MELLAESIIERSKSTQILCEESQIDESTAAAVQTVDGDVLGRLFVFTPSGPQSVINVTNEKDIIVGRSPSCSFQLSQSTASNKHFRIYVVVIDDDMDPLIYCQDLSSNGTFHNRNLIGKGRVVLLSDGDVLDIRHCASFLFQQKLKFAEKVEHEYTGDEYTISNRLLGCGGFSKIYMACNKKTGRQVACKIIDKSKLSSKHFLEDHEIKILRELKHPNIVRTEMDYNSKNQFFIFEELITGGDLFSYLNKMGTVPEINCLLIVYQILKALHYLHKQNIAHRDIKLENILLVSSNELFFRIVLTDFGVARQAENGQRMSTYVGTPEYTAPEIKAIKRRKLQRGECSYGLEVDLWSLGIILYLLLSGTSPTFQANPETLQPQVQFTGNIWKKVSRQARDLITKLLEPEPSKRLNVLQTQNHPWIARHRSRLEKLYEKHVLCCI